jgi:nitrogenase molybdenum-cofactor synthesis protein NifE
MIEILDARKNQVFEKGKDSNGIECGKASTAGSVSQRACVFCGSRVVLYPIADALHLIHGPIGCAAYTWDIRGSLSSGSELHRMSFSTDIHENEVIYGGEKKLYAALCELIAKYEPKAAFVYSTCIVGLIGDDVGAICARVEKEHNIQVIPVHSEGFKGTKKDGYRAACEAVFQLTGKDNVTPVSPFSINILGDFNLAGETWIIKEYYRRMGVEVTSCITGDGRVAEIGRAHRASLNVVQCSGSMTYLAKMMKEQYGIPFIRVSYFGIEDMSAALYDVAAFFKNGAVPGNAEISARAGELVVAEVTALLPELEGYRKDLEGKKAAIYVGGSFKAFSLVKALRHLGVGTVVVGSQTGSEDDYDYLKEITDEGTIIVDDANPLELSKFILEKGADILIGGVKERPIAYKMGIAFCDHNHERKEALAGLDHESRMEMFAGSDKADGRTEMKEHFASTRNACKLCAPLGASIAFRGVEGCIPLIHGSQGCSTYIRRYGISHFREPIDIASSNFTESSAIFGGRGNLHTALDNVTRQYRPRAIGITSTCLSETIGENIPMYLKEYAFAEADRASMECVPEIFHASTPSYKGTHMDGFHEAVFSVIRQLSARPNSPGPRRINLISGFVSAEDLRELHEILASYGLPYTLLPDYSKTLDGGSWEEYQRLPEGGTPLEDIGRMNCALGTVYLGRSVADDKNPALWLEEKFGIPAFTVDLPIGIANTDSFFTALEKVSSRPMDEKWKQIRGRLVDAYIDGHKYCYGKKAIVYGDEDFVCAVSSFLDEIGIVPVIAATGGESAHFRERMKVALKNCRAETGIMDEADFATILERVLPCQKSRHTPRAVRFPHP